MSPDGWIALGTMTTAIVAVAAAVFAFQQVREMRRTREEQARPFVVVDVQPSRASTHFLNLVIENVGSTVAHNVWFSFDPPLESSDKDISIGDSILVQEGILMLPPGRRIEALFDVSHQRIKSDLPLRYDVEVELQDSRGRRQRPQRYVIDLGYLVGLTRIEEYGIHHVAKSLREIEKRVRKWSDIHGRLKVWVLDEDRHRAEQKGEEAITGKYPTMATTPPPEVLVAVARYAFVRTALRWGRRGWERIRTLGIRYSARDDASAA